MFWATIGLWLVCSSASWAGFATTISLAPVRDNTIFSDSTAITDLSNGSGDFLFAGNTAAGTNFTRRALLSFDLSGIPPDALVSDVSLRIRATREAPGRTEDANYYLHRMLSDWGEGTSDADGEEGRGAGAQTGDATWRHTFYSNSFWSVPGGDFNPEPSSVQFMDSLGAYVFTGAGLIDDAQFFLQNPSLNFGWMLRGDESRIFTARQFGGRNDSDIGPVLDITYSVIPEPDIVGLLMFGSFGLWLRSLWYRRAGV